MSPIALDVVSDVVCPWCYVGKRRLEQALRRRPDVAVTVRFHPFQLDPTIPPGGLDRQRYMLGKFGSQERLDEIHARLEQAGRQVGLAFAFGRITRAVNTLDAHRLLMWAARAGVQAAVKERLMHAYFMDGLDIGDRGVLATLAEEAGLDRTDVAAALEGDEDVARVRADVGQAVRIGVTGVPFFIFAQSFAVPGAQDPDVLVQALDRAREEQASPAAPLARA